ncbi:hypothetical protein N9N28_01345 [Rubripirellula amarantea]|uniref:Uncharacterized protein n=1 Tax=Rubripirellula amarantea TaxID=2527999 RepID=A0A5C5WHF4_9BACT|nr:hypothetical protein [Rubripirellula amarantea]MDA8743251.1 hypothetical protein [Rubripirellula amarantea]TWT49515.1 hypothetical protein Pla22_47120 [Rubripirellula amarantea]
MPKALCLFSLVASILIVVLFVADAALGMMGSKSIAPMGGVNTTLDIVFAIVGGILIYLSWSTYREQR